jgi:hypothetical protein
MIWRNGYIQSLLSNLWVEECMAAQRHRIKLNVMKE